MGHLPEYSKEDICYTCLKLREGGFITAVLSDVQRNYMPEVVCLMDITYRGHEFLNGVRDPKIWVKIKNVAKLAGNTAIQTLGTIALEVAKKIALEAILSQDV